jgi:hypothetical protein
MPKEQERQGLGRKVKVTFSDGETIVGYTPGYAPGRKTFFVFPADPETNNDKIFVITLSTDKVEFV